MALREHYAASAAGPVTTTSNTAWTNAATLAFTAANAREYIVFWALTLANTSNNSSDAKFRVTSAGTQKVLSNVESRNLAEDSAFAGFYKITGAGASHTVNIDIQAETSGNTISAGNVRITVIALGPNDRYVENAGRQAVTTGGSTFTTLATVDYTPDVSGDFLTLACSLVDNYAATVPAFARIMVNDVPSEEFPCGVAEVSQMNYVPLMAGYPTTLASGVPSTLLFQGRTHISSNTSGWTDRRFLVLYLGDFESADVGDAYDDVVSTSTTPTTVATITPEASTNDYLLLAHWATASEVSSLPGTVTVTENGSAIATSYRQTFATSTSRGTSSAFVGVVQGSAPTNKTWGLTVASSSTTGYVAKWGSRVYALNLGSDAAPTTDAVGTITSDAAASGVGIAGKQSVGSGSGVGAVAAVGLALAAAVGTIASGSTESGAGRAVKTAVGAITSTGTATAAGVAVNIGVGSATGSGEAAAEGWSTASSVGSSDGAGAATGVGAKVAAAVGTASGDSSVAGVGGSVTPGTYGTATGTATTAGAGRATAGAEGVAGGYVAVDGRGASVAASVGTAPSTSVVQGAGAGVKIAVGTASGDATGSAVGSSTASSVGQAQGQSDATGTGQTGNVVAEAVGTSNSVGLASATGRAILTFVGVSGGTSVVSGISLQFNVPVERTLVIPQDFRVMRVSLELRTLKIAPDKRSLKVLANNRMV